MVMVFKKAGGRSLAVVSNRLGFNSVGGTGQRRQLGAGDYKKRGGRVKVRW